MMCAARPNFYRTPESREENKFQALLAYKRHLHKEVRIRAVFAGILPRDSCMNFVTVGIPDFVVFKAAGEQA